jgi:hypothetical protein
MKHLSKEKKQHLLLVVLGTGGVLVGIWFGLISWQHGRIEELTAKRTATKTEYQGMTDTLKQSDTITAALRIEQEKLAAAESQMASGDHYAWMINTVRDFKAGHPAVDIPQYSTILLEETTLLPKFPYKQATLTVAGKSFYHELGAFLAEFENEFPYIRVQNLELEPAPISEGGHPQRLAFRMDLVALVKPEA